MTRSSKSKSNIIVSRFISSQDSHFAVDTVKNVFWFCVIALSALGLQSLVEWEESKGASSFTISMLTYVEYAVLFADIVWFMSRLITSTYINVRKAIEEISNYKSVKGVK